MQRAMPARLAAAGAAGAAGLDDGLLVAAMAAGDTAALGQLYDRFVPRMLAVATRMLRSNRDAEDLVQDVFLEAWHRSPHFNPQRGSVQSWLMTRLRSRALDRLRTSRRRHAAVERAKVQPPTGGMADPSDAPDQSAVRGWVRALPKDQRLAIEMAYFDGMSSREIAETLSIPIGTAKSRVSRAISGLRQRMTTPSGEDGSHGGVA